MAWSNGDFIKALLRAPYTRYSAEWIRVGHLVWHCWSCENSADANSTAFPSHSRVWGRRSRATDKSEIRGWLFRVPACLNVGSTYLTTVRAIHDHLCTRCLLLILYTCAIGASVRTPPTGEHASFADVAIKLTRPRGCSATLCQWRFM